MREHVWCALHWDNKQHKFSSCHLTKTQNNRSLKTYLLVACWKSSLVVSASSLNLYCWSFMENLTWQFLHQLSKYLPAVEGIHYLAVSTSPLGLCAGCLKENITWQFLHPLHRGTNTNCSQRDHSVTTSFEQLVHLFRQTEQKTKTKNTVSSNWFVCSGKLTPPKQKQQQKQQHSFKQLVCLVKQTDKPTTTTKTQPT